MRSPISLIAVIGALLLAACTGLGGEPQIIATRPVVTPLPTAAPFPPQPPDLAAGATIYAIRCANCHGPAGAGDGALVLAGEVPNPGNFTAGESARGQTPHDWFLTITNGRIEQLMPPWANALSVQQRWNVALYTYTLHYDPALIEAGAALVDSLDDPMFSDPTALAVLSDHALAERLRAAGLPEADIEAGVVAARARSLVGLDALGQPPPAQPVATEEAAPLAAEDVVGTVSGTVVNGTAGGDLPVDLPVTLYIFDPQFNQQRFEATAGPDGAFRFEDVRIDAANSYAVTATYRDRTFVSRIQRGDPASPLLSLPVTVYELTEDPAVISITGIVYQISAIGDGLQVVQVMSVRNNGDRVFTSGNEVAEGQFAALTVSLPPAAIVMGFPEGGQRYIVSEDQSTVIDTAPVLPGEDHLVQVVYFLPYESEGAIIEQPVNYALAGQVRLLLQPTTLRLTSDQFADIGVQSVGEMIYSGYGGDLNLNAGDVIRFELAGAGAPSAAQVTTPQRDNTLPIILIVVGAQLMLVSGLYWMYLRRRPAPAAVEPAKLIDALVLQIAELDTAHDRGEINHDVYQRRRAELKTRLAELMDDKDGS